MTSALYALSSGSRRVTNAVAVKPTNLLDCYGSARTSVWLVTRGAKAEMLIQLRNGGARHSLIAEEALPRSIRSLVDAAFAVVVEPGERTRLLPDAELRHVLGVEDRHDLFVGVQVVPEHERLILFRGDLRSLIVPFSAFRGDDSPAGHAAPDFEDVEVTDYGQTVRLGRYEASADALLYELDPEARRRQKQRQMQEDPSIGGAIRRLRTQRGLKRSDFPALAEKTLARIERGEVQPRAKTLQHIAARLKVRPDELASY